MGLILLHHDLHDLEVLNAMGTPLPEGTYWDTMGGAYNLCLEPQGLKPLGYRHCGLEMQSYEEQIKDVDEEIALKYLTAAACYDWGPRKERIVRKGNDIFISKPQAVGQRIEKIIWDWANQERTVKHITHIEVEETNKKGETKLKRHTHDWYEKKFGKCPEGCVEVAVYREEPVDIRERWYKIDNELRAPVESALGRMPLATLRDIEEERAVKYAAGDPDATRRIGPILLQKVKDRGLELINSIDQAIHPVVEEMHRYGMSVDVPYYKKFGEECQDRMDQLQYEIYKLTGVDINLGSGPQLSKLLFETIGLPSSRMTKSGDRLSTDKKALEPLRFLHPVVPLVLEWGEVETFKNNFAEVLPRHVWADGNLHATFKLTRVPTGRCATADPNLLAQPTRSDTMLNGRPLGKAIRQGFVAPPGYVYLTADASQIELKCLAHDSGDEKMIAAFHNKEDLHALTGADLFERKIDPTKPAKKQVPKDERSVGKTINFGIVNLMTEVGLLDQCKLQNLAANPWTAGAYIEDALAQSIYFEKGPKANLPCMRFRAMNAGQTGLREPQWIRTVGEPTFDGDVIWLCEGSGWTEELLAIKITKWFQIFTGIKPWHESLYAHVRRFGFVKDMFGRIRYSPELFSTVTKIRDGGERTIANFPIQSAAQGIVKIGMAIAWERIKYYRTKGIFIYPSLWVHDEFLNLVPEHFANEWGEELKDILSNQTFKRMAEMGIELRVPLDAGWGWAKSWADVEK